MQCQYLALNDHTFYAALLYSNYQPFFRLTVRMALVTPSRFLLMSMNCRFSASGFFMYGYCYIHLYSS